MTKIRIFSSGSKKIGGGYSLSCITVDKVAIAKEVLRVENELHAYIESKERFLESSKRSIFEKIIDCKFGMEDKNVDAKEAAENVTSVEESLLRLDLQILELETKVSVFSQFFEIFIKILLLVQRCFGLHLALTKLRFGTQISVIVTCVML